MVKNGAERRECEGVSEQQRWNERAPPPPKWESPGTAGQRGEDEGGHAETGGGEGTCVCVCV